MPESHVTLQGEIPNQEEIQRVELNNCDGKAEVARTEDRDLSVDVTVSQEIADSINLSAEVISVEVQKLVGESFSGGTRRGTSIELKAPPQTHMLFELVWSGSSRIGIVQNYRSTTLPIAFNSFVPTDVRIRVQYDLGCKNGEEGPLPVATNTVMPLTTKTSNLCPLIVSRQQVEAWKVGQVSVPEVHEAVGQFNFLRGSDEGHFYEGAQVPAGAVVATSFSGQDGSAWRKYPVQPLIHSGSYGLFETTDEYIAPNEGACMTITP